MDELLSTQRKLISRERVGARLRRRYDRAQTPLDRLIALDSIPVERAPAMLAERASLDPFVLAERIERAIKEITGAERASRPLAGGRSERAVRLGDRRRDGDRRAVVEP